MRVVVSCSSAQKISLPVSESICSLLNNWRDWRVSASTNSLDCHRRAQQVSSSARSPFWIRLHRRGNLSIQSFVVDDLILRLGRGEVSAAASAVASANSVVGFQSLAQETLQAAAVAGNSGLGFAFEKPCNAQAFHSAILFFTDSILPIFHEGTHTAFLNG